MCTSWAFPGSFGEAYANLYKPQVTGPQDWETAVRGSPGGRKLEDVADDPVLGGASAQRSGHCFRLSLLAAAHAQHTRSHLPDMSFQVRVEC